MDLLEILTDKLISVQIINEDEKDIYFYGFKQGLLLIVNIVTMVTIGLLFKMILESIIFIVEYSILRIYAGGYHASTPFKCYLFSFVMIIVVLWLIKLISWNGFISFIITVVSSIIILLIAPVEDANKPLDQKEKKIFKRRANIILSALIGFVLLFWFMGKTQISICVIMSICLIAIMLALGKIKDIKTKISYS